MVMPTAVTPRSSGDWWPCGVSDVARAGVVDAFGGGDVVLGVRGGGAGGEGAVMTATEGPTRRATGIDCFASVSSAVPLPSASGPAACWCLSNGAGVAAGDVGLVSATATGVTPRTLCVGPVEALLLPSGIWGATTMNVESGCCCCCCCLTAASPVPAPLSCRDACPAFRGV